MEKEGETLGTESTRVRQGQWLKAPKLCICVMDFYILLHCIFYSVVR